MTVNKVVESGARYWDINDNQVVNDVGVHVCLLSQRHEHVNFTYNMCYSQHVLLTRCVSYNT